jgi:hypothetical protein
VSCGFEGSRQNRKASKNHPGRDIPEAHGFGVGKYIKTEN